ncbi:MAG: High-affinity zinc uptake system ATP-binding protein ZnuC [Chlamydiae bacterium]|nr:High-affinity zinc uptake system ATP-binding protein ZnuC [Chlamydiota bacterium]
MTLSVEHLSFSYDRQVPVLEDISFTTKKGDFIGVFGPNGGGKTTLLKLLLGLLTPTKGTIAVQDTSPKNASSRIGYVPQMRRFDRKFPISVLDVVLQGLLASHKGWGGYSHKEKGRAMSALKQVGLEEKADGPFGTLSGGQIQRTLIARALVSEPEILMLDEATVGIDPKALREFFSLLLSLKGKMTIVLVTHDLQVIAKEMDQLLCINRQMTLFAPEEVCQHFAMGLYHPPLYRNDKGGNR